MTTTRRLRLDLAYDGTDFHGWAAQPGRRTVQGALEAALARVTREPVRVTVAGRTDAGVHARGQVAHLDLSEAALAALPGRSDREAGPALVTRLAGVLPPDVVVRSARIVSGDFDARFGALWRRYRFRISDSPAVHDPTRRDVLRLRRPLEVVAMARAAEPLTGEHDFLSFCRPREGASTVRTLMDLDVDRPGPDRADAGLVVVTVRADAFCHHMVRSLVGALIAVGEGRRGPDWPSRVLAARTRTSPGPDGIGAAPMCRASGLSLDRVEYPSEERLALQAAAARTVRGMRHTSTPSSSSAQVSDESGRAEKPGSR